MLIHGDLHKSRIKAPLVLGICCLCLHATAEQYGYLPARYECATLTRVP
jgi:hypothetical protein